MRIDSHIFQVILIGIIFIPAFNAFKLSWSIIFLIFLGLFCGAIYPDTDCKESRIFKMKQDNGRIGWQKSYRVYKSKRDAQNIRNIFLFLYSLILVFLGNLFRYFLYYPSYGVVYLVNKQWVKEDSIKNEHRGISHTLLGIFVSSILFFILLYFVNLFFNLISPNLLFIPFVSFFFAGNLHLLQDSISKWGIKWFYPFKNVRVYGSYSAFDGNSKSIYFVFLLIASVILVFFLSNYIKNNYANLFLISTILLPILFVISSFVILFKFCDVKLKF